MSQLIEPRMKEEVLFMSQDDIDLVRSEIEDRIKDKSKVEKKLELYRRLEKILEMLPKKEEDVPPILKACGIVDMSDLKLIKEDPIVDKAVDSPTGVDKALADLMVEVNRDPFIHTGESA